GANGDTQTVIITNTPKGGLIVEKYDSVTKLPLSGAQFKITNANGELTPDNEGLTSSNGLYTTDRSGQIVLSKLLPGTYVVSEVKAPDNYQADSTPQTVVVNAGDTQTLRFYDDPLCTLTILKRDAVTKKPLKGAEFLVRDSEGRAIGPNNGRYITGTDGTVTVSGLAPNATIVVSEGKAPTGYIKDETPKNIVVRTGVANSLIFDNEPTTTLIIRKFIEGTENEPLSGVCFKVVDGSGAAVGPDDGTYYTDKTGEIVLDGIEPGTTVIAREIKTVEGYVLDGTPQDILIKAGEVQQLTFWNKKAGTLVIQKKDSVSGNLIAGAQFQLTYASGGYVDNNNGHLSSNGLYTTDDKGEIRISGVTGTIVAKEVKAAPGYVIDQSTQTQTVTVNPEDTQTLVFLNEPLCSLTLTKLDSVTGKPVPGTEFIVKDGNGTVLGRYTTGKDGTVTVSGLVPGSTIVVSESKVPSGYVLNTTPQTIIVRNGSNSVTSGTGGSSGGGNTGNNGGTGGGNDLTFENDPKTRLVIEKYVTGTTDPLKGVTFLVTESNGQVVGSSNGEYITDENGRIVIEGLEPGVTITAKEIKTLEGYVLDTTPKSIKIKVGEAQTLRFYNQKQGCIVVKKLDKQTGEPLAGVEFQITYSDGSYLDDDYGHLSSKGLYKTDANGEIRISGVVGTLVITETKPLPGYVMDEGSRTQTVKVNPTDTQTITVYNTKIGGLTIIKKDEETGERIKGVQFEIRKLNGEIVGTYTTDQNGVISLPEAEKGWYQVTELKAAKGYQLDDTPHQIEVKDGGTATLEITNRQTGSALIHKVDSLTGEGIYGVTFLLSDAKGNPVGTYQSDNEGYVYVDGGLADGKYTIREIECAPGYILDTQPKTIYVEYGGCTTITWPNTAVRGQIQIVKKSADYNPTNGLPAGTLLEGATFEICNERTGNKVDTIVTGANGLASSKALPLGRYTIRETKAPANYGASSETYTAVLEYSGQIVKLEITNKSLSTGVSIEKTGPKEATSGQPVRYVFSRIGNTSNVMLQSFYWRDTLPAAVRLDKVVTGTYNFPGTYKIVYKVNNTGDYRTLADSLSTSRNYTLAASPTALGLAANEHVTEIMFVFGQVPGGFSQVEAPMLYCKAVSGLTPGSSFVNVADVGGTYDGVWVQAVTRWVTTVYGKPTPLPKTGY
ncbi:collagen binding domain-containing protein, partial [uncultured Oscillibacter sp.]|uniref:MSCRAMM family protein n=1 Tax=uncultured Oscillibacter sp. TaxID=876091 RepID=UPI0025CD1BBC